MYPPYPPATRAEIIARCMRWWGYSSAQVARLSSRLGPLYALGPNFLQNIRAGAIPSFYHLCALSEVLCLRIGNVFRIFDIDLEALLELELRLNPERTRLIETCPFGQDKTVFVPSLLTHQTALRTTVFLDHLVADWKPVSLLTLNDAAWRNSELRYGKLGIHDTNASPNIPPGAYVQMRPLEPGEVHHLEDDGFYFVQHPQGYTVCRCRYSNRWLQLRSNDPSFAGPHQLSYGKEVLILGRVTAFAAALPATIYRQSTTPQESLVTSVPANLPWAYTSPKQLLVTEGRRLRPSPAHFQAAADDLEKILGFHLTAKYARELETSPHQPRTLTALALSVLYSIRITDLFRSHGIILNKARKFDIDYLLSLRGPGDLSDGLPPASPPQPPELWNNVRIKWKEWPWLAARWNSHPQHASHAILRLHQSDYYPGLDPLLLPGSLLSIDIASHHDAATFSIRNGHESDWARRLYILRLNTRQEERIYCSYLETDARTIFLKAHPKSPHIPVMPLPRSAVTILGTVNGVASHY